MRGRKPDPKNVIPMRPDDAGVEKLRKKAQRKLINSLKPKGLRPDVALEYMRVAKMLAEPSVDRLKPRYLDAIIEYCIATRRLWDFRDAMKTVNLEVYRVKTRNGEQVKCHPYVAQLNETWRQWKTLNNDLGLNPAAERNFVPGQGDFFDESEKYFR